jgi:hypothetical protein
MTALVAIIGVGLAIAAIALWRRAVKMGTLREALSTIMLFFPR